MFETEQTYWWHVAKRRLVTSFIPKGQKILDIGCGTGAMMLDLTKNGDFVSGVDGSPESLKFSKSRGLKKVSQADFEKKLSEKNSHFDIVTCLDVLEHISNDDQLLREFHRILKPGGKVYLTVPAYQALWTYWDVMLGHKRRYRKSNLVAKIEKNGFTVVWSSYFYSFLLPVALVFRILKNTSRRQTSDFVKLPDIINNALLLLCQLERKVLNVITLPFGLSIIIIAQKT